MQIDEVTKTEKKLQPSEMLKFTQKQLRDLKTLLTDEKFCDRNFFQPVLKNGKTIEAPLEVKRKQLVSSIEKVSESLRSPRIVFTTLGTTSAGKSTLVNVLCGKSIAPVHSDETSAGELRVTHQDSDTYSCEIIPHHDKKNNVFAKEYTDPAQAYNAMYDEMCDYHKMAPNAKRDSIAPIFNISTSIKIGERKDCFGVPEFVNVELLDLPGLKNLGDQANIEVIQKRLRYSFPIVCLDYSEADDLKRAKLISLLEGLLQDDGTAIFVLNKYDHKNSFDEIANITKIERFQYEIKTILKLHEVPTIVPMSARVLQIAELLITGEYKSVNDLADHFFGPIKKQIMAKISDKEERRKTYMFVDSLEKKYLFEEPVSNSENKQLLDLAIMASGFNDLQNAIKEKITSSFGSVLIQPTVGKLLLEIKEFWSSINDQYDVYTLARTEEINKIEESLEKIDNIIKSVSQEEKKGISDFFAKLLKDLLHILGEGKNSNFETEINGILKAASTKGYAEKFTKRIGDIHRSIGQTINRDAVEPFLNLFSHFCQGENASVINAEIEKIQKDFPKIPITAHLIKFFKFLEAGKRDKEKRQVTYTHKGVDPNDTVKEINSSLMNDYFLCIKLCATSVTQTILQRKCGELNQAINEDVKKEGRLFFENFKKQVSKNFPQKENNSRLEWSDKFNAAILDVFVKSIEKRIDLSVEMSTLNTDFVGNLFANINNDWKSTAKVTGSASTSRRELDKVHSCTENEYKTVTTPDTRETTYYWSVAETSQIWSNKINSQRPLYLEKLVNWSSEVLSKEIENIFSEIHENINNQKITLAKRKAAIQGDVQKYDDEWQCLIEDDLPIIEEKRHLIKQEIGGHHE